MNAWSREMEALSGLPTFVSSAKRVMAIGVTVALLVLTFTPWQQSATGGGKVIAYSPSEREQNIEAPIEGKLVRWYVLEGQHVQKGDPLVDLSDNDPQVIRRIGAETEAIRARLTAAKARVDAIEERIDSLRGSRESGISGADSRVRMAEQRRHAADNAVASALAAAKAARLNLERQEALFEQGLTSKRAVEVAEADDVRARTEGDRAKASLMAANNEISALSSDQLKLGTDATASIADALAGKAAAESEIASATAELTRIEGRLARQSTQHVQAPTDGTLLHVRARFSGEIVKAGDLLATFVPDSNDLAVEFSVGGNDVNLVRIGAPVRLQFEGWPAVHLTGWPSAAIGTFPGRVSFVDSASTEANGRFRVVVTPEGASAWPSRDHLRQGMRASGWIILGRVRLGYELWRQFNGFPPEWTGGAAPVGSTSKKDGLK